MLQRIKHAWRWVTRSSACFLFENFIFFRKSSNQEFWYMFIKKTKNYLFCIIQYAHGLLLHVTAEEEHTLSDRAFRTTDPVPISTMPGNWGRLLLKLDWAHLFKHLSALSQASATFPTCQRLGFGNCKQVTRAWPWFLVNSAHPTLQNEHFPFVWKLWLLRFPFSSGTWRKDGSWKQFNLMPLFSRKSR